MSQNRVDWGIDSGAAVRATINLTRAFRDQSLGLDRLAKTTNTYNREGRLQKTVVKGVDTAGRKYTKTVQRMADGTIRHRKTVESATTELSAGRKILVKYIAGIQLLHVGIRALIQGFREGTRTMVEFSIKVGEIRTIQGKAIKTQKEWIDGLASVSREFGFDTLDTAKAAYQALSNQVADATNVMVFLSDAAKFARVGVTDLTTSVDLLSTVMNSYGYSANSAIVISSVLQKTIEYGRITAEQLGKTLGNLTSVSSQLGISLFETSAALTVITRSGIDATAASTALQALMQKLLSPTEALSAKFEEWGVSSGEAAVATFGFVGVMKKLGEEVKKGGGAELSKLLSRLRAVRGAGPLIRNLEELEEALEQVGGSAIGLEEVIEDFENNFKKTSDQTGRLAQKITQNLQTTFAVDFAQNFLELFVELDRAIGGFNSLVLNFAQSFKVIAKAVSLVLWPFAKIVSLLQQIPGGITTVTALFTAFAFRARLAAVQTSLAAQATSQLSMGLLLLRSPITLAVQGLFSLGAAFRTFLATVWPVVALTVAIEGVIAVFDHFRNAGVRALKAISDAAEVAQQQLATLRHKQLIDLEEAFQKVAQRVSAFRRAMIGINDDISRRLTPALQNGINYLQKFRDLIEVKPATTEDIVKDAVSQLEQLKKALDNIEGAQAKRELDLALSSLADTGNINDLQNIFASLEAEAADAFNANNVDAYTDAIGRWNSALNTGLNAATRITEQANNELTRMNENIINMTRSMEQQQFDLSISGLDDFERAAQMQQRIDDLRQRASAPGADPAAARAALQEAAQLAGQLARMEAQEFGGGADTSQFEAINRQRIALEEQLRDTQQATVNAAQNQQQALTDAQTDAQLDQQRNLQSLQEATQQIALAEANRLQIVQNLIDAQTELLSLQKQIKEEFLEASKAESEASKERIAVLQRLQKHITDTDPWDKWEPKIDLKALNGTKEQIQAEFNRLYAEIESQAPPKSSLAEADGTIYKEHQYRLDKLRELEEQLLAAREKEQQGKAEAQRLLDEKNRIAAELNNLDQRLANANIQFVQAVEEGANRTEQAIAKLNEALDAAAELRRQQDQGQQQARATGGLLYGRGGSDTNMVSGTRGEFMVNQQATRQFYPQLTAYNAQLPQTAATTASRTVSIGDINMNVTSTGNAVNDVRSIGQQLNREVRRGTFSYGS